MTKHTTLRRLFTPAFSLFMFLCLSTGSVQAGNLNYRVELIHKEKEQKVDIEIGGRYFTSYLYGNPLLKKPVLFPLVSASGKTVTRGFPLDTRPSERIDHTHHYGVWFNHGDVNGVDFWNAGRTPPKPGVRYGMIKHDEILAIESGKIGTLSVSKKWIDDKGHVLIYEKTQYQFSGEKNRRLITHTTNLSAANQTVRFNDSKEGLFAIRVARQLEVPSSKPTVLTGQDLQPSSARVDNTHVSGHYKNSEGLEGYPEVWGKRARWMQLSGKIEEQDISILIFDSPNNVNHPPHWMARDYGLFGVNGLGSAIYTEGEEVLNYTLEKNVSRVFKHQLIVTDSQAPNKATIEKWYKAFTQLPRAITR